MAVIRKQRGHFLEDFVPGDVLPPQGRQDGHRGAVRALHRLLDDHEPALEERSLRAGVRLRRSRRAARPRDAGRVQPERRGRLRERARQPRVHRHALRRAGLRRRHASRPRRACSASRARRATRCSGVVHVQTTGRNQRGEVVLTFQRKVQVWKRDQRRGAARRRGRAGATSRRRSRCRRYDPARRYGELAHLTNADSYLEDFTPGDVIEHSRGRVVTTDHIMLTGILDNTSQVHCNQWMVSQDPERFVGGQLIVFGGIPFNLCLGISSADVGDNSLGDVRYATGRHTAPIFAGDTVFASTEIRGVARLSRPTRPRRARARRCADTSSSKKGDDDREGGDLLPRARDRREAPEPLHRADDAAPVRTVGLLLTLAGAALAARSAMLLAGPGPSAARAASGLRDRGPLRANCATRCSRASCSRCAGAGALARRRRRSSCSPRSPSSAPTGGSCASRSRDSRRRFGPAYGRTCDACRAGSRVARRAGGRRVLTAVALEQLAGSGVAGGLPVERAASTHPALEACLVVHLARQIDEGAHRLGVRGGILRGALELVERGGRVARLGERERAVVARAWIARDPPRRSVRAPRRRPASGPSAP